jgi:hypothetical protein
LSGTVAKLPTVFSLELGKVMLKNIRQGSAGDQSAPKEPDLHRVLELRNFLEGRWSVVRLFVDRGEHKSGTFLGRAYFVEAGEGLAYREEGQMRYGDYSGIAKRYYVYSFSSAYYAKVQFADGRLFHDLDLRQGYWQTIHRCGEDRYRGRIQACSPERWELGWEVLGPCKDFRIASRYIRCSDADN